MKLVIVESPKKCETIAKYLGEDYVVKATKGHIRDLATCGKGGLGVDVENNFKATYKVSHNKFVLIDELKKLAKQADEVILATDPDREGEAISWHLCEVLGLDPKKTKRLEFHEITREAIQNAITNPRVIDMNLVSSQETRRIIDRIMGFKLSSIAQSKLKARSAGRVQSAVLKLICDHENEILNFKKEEYWNIDTFINLNGTETKLILDSYNGKDVKLENEEAANEFVSKIGKKLKVKDIKKTIRKVEVKNPFTTSTLQQEANIKFKFSPEMTARIAQQLYEGVEIDGELIGLITYTRTDTTKLSATYVAKAKKYIIENYGEEYFDNTKKLSKAKAAQEAHEPIRPTHNSLTPEKIKKYLSPTQYKIYDLIYRRTLASLMSAKKIETKTAILETNGILYETRNHKTIFDGYTVLFKNSEQDTKEESSDLSNVKIGDEFDVIKVDKIQKFTEPPSRYSEAKIVGIMEEKGIGRPSTYATTIHNLLEQKRDYANVKDGLVQPSEKGMTVSHVFNKYFSEFISADYTAQMELDLDKIQDSKSTSNTVLKEFYEKFMHLFEIGVERIYKEQGKVLGVCPECGQPLVEKRSKYGTFVACSDYKNCKYVVPTAKEPNVYVEGRVCPICGNKLLVKKDKKGKEYIICENYSKCKYSESSKPKAPTLKSDKKCPKCGADLVYRKVAKGKKKGSVFLGCSNFPKCKYIEDVEDK